MADVKNKVTRVKDILPCELTDGERLGFADELAEATQAAEQAKLNKQTVVQQHNSEIKLAKSRCERLANIVANKTEYREVVVEECINYAKDEFTRTRTDTGEQLACRKLTDKEKQIVLPIDGESEDE